LLFGKCAEPSNIGRQMSSVSSVIECGSEVTAFEGSNWAGLARIPPLTGRYLMSRKFYNCLKLKIF